MKKLVLIPLVTITFLSGCVSSIRTAAPSNLSEGESALLVVDSTDGKLTPEYTLSSSASTAGGAAGGLIGSLIGSAIDASRNKKNGDSAKELAQSFLSAVQEDNLNDVFLNAFREEWSAQSNPIAQTSIIKLAKDEDIMPYIENVQEDYAIAISPIYKINPSSNSLSIHYFVTINAVGEVAKKSLAEHRSDKDEKDLYYKNILSVKQPLNNIPVKDQFDTEEAWLQALNEVIINSFKEATANAVTLLTYDLSLKEIPKQKPVEYADILNINGMQMKGKVEKRFESGQKAVRLLNDSLFFVP